MVSRCSNFVSVCILMWTIRICNKNKNDLFSGAGVTIFIVTRKIRGRQAEKKISWFSKIPDRRRVSIFIFSKKEHFLSQNFPNLNWPRFARSSELNPLKKTGGEGEKRGKKCSSYFNNELTSLRSVIVPKQLITQAYGLRSLAKWYFIFYYVILRRITSFLEELRHF